MKLSPLLQFNNSNNIDLQEIKSLSINNVCTPNRIETYEPSYESSNIGNVSIRSNIYDSDSNVDDLQASQGT